MSLPFVLGDMLPEIRSSPSAANPCNRVGSRKTKVNHRTVIPTTTIAVSKTVNMLIVILSYYVGVAIKIIITTMLITTKKKTIFIILVIIVIVIVTTLLRRPHQTQISESLSSSSP